MSDALLDDEIVMTVGSAWLNQMDLSSDVWHILVHDVHFSARHLADVLIWHEKYPDDHRVTHSDCLAALCFLSRLERRYSKSAVMYVHESCAGDESVAGKVFSLIIQHCEQSIR